MREEHVAAVDSMRELKDAIDPDDILNSGKCFRNDGGDPCTIHSYRVHTEREP